MELHRLGHLPRWKLVKPGHVIEGCIMISRIHLMITLRAPDRLGRLYIADSTQRRFPQGMGKSRIELRTAGDHFEYRTINQNRFDTGWAAVFIVRPLQ